MRPAPASNRRSRRALPGRLGRVLGCSLLLVALGPLGAVRADDPDREPLPPRTFFWQPDAQTAAEVADLLAKSFADRSKAPLARDQFVRRYKLLAVPQLVDEVRGAVAGRSTNQPVLWNTVLTLGAMRDRLGPARHLWPALEPLNRLLGASSEIFERTFGALALGSWHWTEAERQVTPETPKGGEAHEAARTKRMKRQMDTTLRRLGDAVGDFNPYVRTAALLALAKRGGSHAGRATMDAIERLEGASPEVAWAALLAQAFLRERTGAPYLAALATDKRGLKRAAGLAVSVGALQEGAGELDWVKRPAKTLEALTRGELNPFDGPELVFARGVLTWQRQLNDEWEKLWQIAISPRMDSEIAVAAVQALLFCQQDWFKRSLMTWARGESGRTLSEPVLAGFLLLAATEGNAAGVGAAARYLEHPGRRPKGTRSWDVRFHAAVGLARAFASGAIKEPTLRTQALDALRGGLRSMHKEAPFRAELERWLEAHAERITKDAHHRPEEESVRRLEQAFTCPHALLSRDLIDVCVHRVNKLTLRLFGAHNVQPTSGDSPEKSNTPLLFLRSYLEAYPYFSRLEFQWRRGARDLPSLPADDPRSIDR
ncbi:MAG: hypothetical protein QNJ98_10630 [Planctomycetota bacterium]|nr:hypothetical protein [Planctomycetota bacterium]